ncbi:MAG: methyltransferase domain-containing protein [Desulfurococcales archaeon]|nr:methyltransferase domain-containing protein [Desulfurococcales archaeon]
MYQRSEELRRAEEWLARMALALGSRQIVPFVPVREEIIPFILDALELGPDDVFYDLGCGDGRVAVAAARDYGVRKSVCVEINESLAMAALERAALEGVAEKVVVLNADFMSVSIDDATAVYLYLLSSVNEALRPKLELELRPGARVASLDFPVPGWEPNRVIGEPGWQRVIYLYRMPPRRTG